MKPKTKPAAKPERRRYYLSPTAFLVKSVQMGVPGMLDSDKSFRDWIIGHLVDGYRYEVVNELAAAKQREAKAKRKAAHA